MKILLGSDVHCCQCKHSPSVPASNKIFFQKKQDTETHVRSMVRGENMKGM